MKIYLDNCCFNRPFDQQDQIRVYLETQAKLHIQDLIKQSKIQLVWSFMLDIENRDNPFSEKRFTIQKWDKFAYADIDFSDDILLAAKEIIKLGLRNKDALHIISAYTGNCSYFITTDDEICKKIIEYKGMKILNPIDFIKVIEVADL